MDHKDQWMEWSEKFLQVLPKAGERNTPVFTEAEAIIIVCKIIEILDSLVVGSYYVCLRICEWQRSATKVMQLLGV